MASTGSMATQREEFKKLREHEEKVEKINNLVENMVDDEELEAAAALEAQEKALTRKRAAKTAVGKQKAPKKRKSTARYAADDVTRKQLILEKKLAKMSPDQVMKIKIMVERGLLDEETLYDALTQEPPSKRKRPKESALLKKTWSLKKGVKENKQELDEEDEEEEGEADDGLTVAAKRSKKQLTLATETMPALEEDYDDDQDSDGEDYDHELDPSSMGLTPVEMVLLQQQAQQNEMMENFKRSQDQLAEYNDMIASFFVPPDKRAEASMTEADRKKTAQQKEAFRLKYFNILQEEMKKKREEENLQRQAALVYEMIKKDGKKNAATSSASRSVRPTKVNKKNANTSPPPSFDTGDTADNISDDELASNPTLQQLLANY